MFYVSYRPSLAESLLALPKKGKLSLPRNYRGMQMLTATGALDDRILVNRLDINGPVLRTVSLLFKMESPQFTSCSLYVCLSISRRRKKYNVIYRLLK